jgi:CRISPR type III-A-associated RAMP protein Csm4
VFGVPAEMEYDNATRLVVRDAELTDTSAKKLQDARTDLLYAELKTEVAIDRVTSAATPRTLERVPAGAEFGPTELVFSIYEAADYDRLKTVIDAMQLVEDDYLGGSGSRGYGKVEFTDIKVYARSRQEYSAAPEIKEFASVQELANAFDNLKAWLQEVVPVKGRVFHFGEHGIGQEESRITWPSDSLFAALVARLALTRDTQAVEDWLGTAEQPKTPPFLLTSTFPMAGDVCFFPVPLAALHPKDDNSLPEGWRFKDLKKVRFVSEGIYRLLLRNCSLAGVLANERVDTRQGKTVLLLEAERAALPKALQRKDAEFWKAEKRPRVAVGRATNNSNLFHVGAVRFAEECGLWFGVQWLTEIAEQRALLADLLAELGDAGLGAERTSGYGQAMIAESTPLDLPDPNGGPWTTLSRYRPAVDEIPALQTPEASYQIVHVGGWMDTANLRRRALNLLAEGAVLGVLEKPTPYGAVADVRPRAANLPRQVEHPVWRLGLAVAVGYGGAR